jgi:hypothetical protein
MLDAITCRPKVSLISERLSWLRGRAVERVSPRFRREIHLQGLIDMCHESREKFVYIRDKLGTMQNISLIEREC